MAPPISLGLRESNDATSAPACRPTGLHALPQEVLDGVVDTAISSGVPYPQLAAVSRTLRTTALHHATQALRVARRRPVPAAVCLPQAEWLLLHRADMWLAQIDARDTTHAGIDAGTPWLEALGPGALRLALRPWVAQEGDGARMPAAKIVAAYRSGAAALQLHNFGVAALPEAIGQLNALRVLNLRGNYLSMLPESLGCLTALEVLDIGNSWVFSIPESVAGLRRLRAFRFDAGTPAGALSADPTVQRLRARGVQICVVPAP